MAGETGFRANPAQAGFEKRLKCHGFSRGDLQLEHKFTYPFSDELIQYLQAMGISYEIKHNEKRVEVPLFQRYISGDGIFTSNGEEYIGEKPRPWDSDLLGPDEVIFKDETKIKIPPKPIPVPMGN